jgi:hypothetical protein
MNAEWLTQLLAIIALLVLPQNIKYRRCVPFQFGFISTLIYSGFLFAAVYIQLMFSSDLNLQITFWSIMIFSFGCMILYLADLFSIYLEKIWLIWSLSILCSLMVIAVDAFVLPDAWFVNNIIALLVVGALIKFVVIKKLKAAVIPIVFLWFLFIFRQFFVIFRL